MSEEKSNRALASVAEAAPLGRRRTRLHDIRAVRRYLSKVARDLEAETLDTLTTPERLALARGKTYTALALAGVIRADELEGRITELERLITARGI